MGLGESTGSIFVCKILQKLHLHKKVHGCNFQREENKEALNYHTAVTTEYNPEFVLGKLLTPNLIPCIKILHSFMTNLSTESFATGMPKS